MPFLSLSCQIIGRSYWLTFLVKFEQITCIHLLYLLPWQTTCATSYIHLHRPSPVFWLQETPSRVTLLHQTFNRHCHRGLDHLTLVQNFPGPSHWLRGEDTSLWWLLLPSWHHANILIAHVSLSWWPPCCPRPIPTSGPLHWLVLSSGSLSLQIAPQLIPPLLPGLHWMPLFSDNHNSVQPPSPILLILLSPVYLFH